jgi:hypothetical protein
MYEEIRIEFSDGTSTLEWVYEDVDMGEVLVEVAEDCNVDASEIVGYTYTGRTQDGPR